MKYKVIKSEDQYEDYLEIFEKLMDIDLDCDDNLGDEFDLLALIIGDYEDKNYRLDKPEPKEALKFRIEQMIVPGKCTICNKSIDSGFTEILDIKIPICVECFNHYGDEQILEILGGE